MKYERKDAIRKTIKGNLVVLKLKIIPKCSQIHSETKYICIACLHLNPEPGEEKTGQCK